MGIRAFLIASVFATFSANAHAGYVRNDPINNVDTNGEETHIIATSYEKIDWIGITTLDAQHITVITDRGGESGGASIYDPSGDGRMRDSHGNPFMGSGQLGTADSFGEPLDSQTLINSFAAKEANVYGTMIEVSSFNTTLEQEKQITQNAEAIGGGGICSCAINSSNAVAGVGDIPNVTSYFPNKIRDVMKESADSYEVIRPTKEDQ